MSVHFNSSHASVLDVLTAAILQKKGFKIMHFSIILNENVLFKRCEMTVVSFFPSPCLLNGVYKRELLHK